MSKLINLESKLEIKNVRLKQLGIKNEKKILELCSSATPGYTVNYYFDSIDKYNQAKSILVENNVEHDYHQK